MLIGQVESGRPPRETLKPQLLQLVLLQQHQFNTTLISSTSSIIIKKRSREDDKLRDASLPTRSVPPPTRPTASNLPSLQTRVALTKPPYLFARIGKVRLAKWFQTLPPKSKAKIVKDVTQLVLARRTRMCNFLEYKGMSSNTHHSATTSHHHHHHPASIVQYPVPSIKPSASTL